MHTGELLLKAIADHPAQNAPPLIYADWLEDHGEAEKSHWVRAGVVKRFGIDFHSEGGALTLDAEEVSDDPDVIGGIHTRSHGDGWIIRGQVCEDYFVWVNEFAARHPQLGAVWGDFEGVVFASSEEAFADFYAKHPPFAWDYGDI